MDVLTALQDDFKLFLQALWGQLDFSVLQELNTLLLTLQNGPKRLQVQAFRGVGKSWITGAFVLWTLFKDPEEDCDYIRIERAQIHVHLLTKTNYANTMAQTFATEIGRSEMESHQFRRELFSSPGTFCQGVGITGQLTGSRADLMVLDDVEVLWQLHDKP